MKNFEKFVEEVKDNIMEYLPEEYVGAEIELREHRKLNETYTAISVRKEDQNIVPNINLESFYKEYDGSVRGMDETMKEIANVIQKKLEIPDLNVLTNYDLAKDNLFIRVSSLEQNQDLVDKVPHITKEDLLITYHIAAEISEDGMATTMVNNNMMDHFGISAEQLHEDALASSQHILPASIRSMNDVVRPMILSEMLYSGMSQEEAEAQLNEMMKDAGPELTVVSNDRTQDGAGVIFYPGVMEQLADKLGGDFFILPSSVHESLVLPDDGNVDAQSLREMVQEVNDTQVAPEDKLTDEVYHFDSKDRVFEKAASFADRLKAKEKVAESVAEKKEYNQKEKELMKPKRRSTEMSI